MNPDWHKHLRYFIDPKLRSFDKDLFKSITQDLESLKITWLEELDGLVHDEILPTTFLLASDTSLEPAIRDFDKTLLFGDGNMSIFGKREFGGENHSINSQNDWEGFFSNLDRNYGTFFEQAGESLLNESLSLFRSMVKRGTKLDFTKAKGSISKFEEEMLGVLNLDEAREILPKVSKELLGAPFHLKSGAQVYCERDGLGLPLAGSDQLYLCWEGSTTNENILRVYSIMEDILSRDTGELAKAESIEDMQQILSELPMPLALFNQNHELVLHNPNFIKLNLGAKSALALEDEQQFNHGGELYRAKRRKLKESDYELLTFIPVKEFLGASSSPSSEELGIISSSIAHELNNPLGGVSGALDVLLLDEHPSEREQSLRDMKAGVSRCKKLVETFLGFSKLEAVKQTGEGGHDIESCLNSAMELVRFRLIENNVSMETKFESLKSFTPKFNPHVMSMTIYLILGDLLTSFGHHKLVAGERSANLHLRFWEDEKSLAFSSMENLGLGDDFLKSKLLNHLLEIQNLRIESDKESTRLYAQ